MGGARVTTLFTLRKCTLGNKREIKTLKFVLASTKGFKGGLAWIKPSKKDMAVTFSYSRGGEIGVPKGGHFGCSKWAKNSGVLPIVYLNAGLEIRSAIPYAIHQEINRDSHALGSQRSACHLAW